MFEINPFHNQGWARFYLIIILLCYRLFGGALLLLLIATVEVASTVSTSTREKIAVSIKCIVRAFISITKSSWLRSVPSTKKLSSNQTSNYDRIPKTLLCLRIYMCNEWTWHNYINCRIEDLAFDSFALKWFGKSMMRLCGRLFI